MLFKRKKNEIEFLKEDITHLQKIVATYSHKSVENEIKIQEIKREIHNLKIQVDLLYKQLELLDEKRINLYNVPWG